MEHTQDLLGIKLTQQDKALSECCAFVEQTVPLTQEQEAKGYKTHITEFKTINYQEVQKVDSLFEIEAEIKVDGLTLPFTVKSNGLYFVMYYDGAEFAAGTLNL